MTAIHPLKAYRRSQTPKLSQADLAARLGVSRMSVLRWENGGKIETARVPSIAEKTGIPPRELRPDLVELIGGGAQ